MALLALDMLLVHRMTLLQLITVFLITAASAMAHSDSSEKPDCVPILSLGITEFSDGFMNDLSPELAQTIRAAKEARMELIDALPKKNSEYEKAIGFTKAQHLIAPAIETHEILLSQLSDRLGALNQKAGANKAEIIQVQWAIQQIEISLERCVGLRYAIVHALSGGTPTLH